MSTYDVAVVGRGAIGLAAALAFARAGRRVALVGPDDGAADPAMSANAAAGDDLAAWDARVYALSPASRRLLMELGVWQLMDSARVAPIHDMRIFRQSDEGARKPAPEVHLDAYQGRVEALAWIVEDRQLQDALKRMLAATVSKEKLAQVRAEVEGLTLPLKPQDAGPAMLALAGGGKLTARLVVAADGTSSRLRHLADIDHVVRDFHQTAVVANFEATRPHRDCAWQWFGDFGVVALLPLPSDDLGYGRSRVSLVWSAPTEVAVQAQRAEPGWLAARVRAMTDGTLGDLQLITAPAAFALRGVRCREVIKPSFVLIGDAAHAVHPMAGQGMNLGFGDVRGLMNHVVAPGTGGFGPRAPDWFDLRRYERSRREPVALMQWALEGLHWAFGDLPAPLVGLREVGWSIVARSSWLRRRMIEHAVS